jgi:Pentapeptide repeats (8 copies)
VEAWLMRWLKRDKWKVGFAIVGTLLLLVTIVWVPASAVGAHGRVSGLAASVTGTVQSTPIEDATVTALNKEKLAQEVQQLKNENEPSFFDWLRGNVSILLLGLGALAGFLRWLADRRDARDKELKDRQEEREKRAEERFQSIVEGLGNEREEAQVGAAITLRTFLQPIYEQFYRQVFDLTVAHLRLQGRSVPLDGDSNTSLPLSSLRQALIVVFKEAFPLARSQNKGSPRYLDASRIQLDNAYLREADLKQVWLRHASLRHAILHRADLRGADLLEADLYGADLRGANLDTTVALLI